MLQAQGDMAKEQKSEQRQKASLAEQERNAAHMILRKCT